MKFSLVSFRMFLLLSLCGSMAYAQPTSTNVQDCIGAIPVCQDVYYESQSYVGEGNVVDVPPIGGVTNACLGQSGFSGQAEVNSVWYQFSVLQGGTFEMDIIPNVFTDDYDWQMWNVTNMSCADIANNLNPSVSCNFSGADGPTGIGSPAPGGVAYEPSFQMAAGEVYVLVINNWTNSTNGYTLDITDATAIFNYTPTVIDTGAFTKHCGDYTVPFKLDGKVRCSSIAPDGSDFRIVDTLGNLIPIQSAVGINCLANYSDSIEITLFKPLSHNGLYFCYTKIGNDFNTLLATCTEIAEFDTIRFVVRDCYDFDTPPRIVNVSVVDDQYVALEWLNPANQGLDTAYFTSYSLSRAQRAMGGSFSTPSILASNLTPVSDTTYDDLTATDVDNVSYGFSLEYNVNLFVPRLLRSDTLIASILLRDRDGLLGDSTLVNPTVYWTPYGAWAAPAYTLELSRDTTVLLWNPVANTLDTMASFSRPTTPGKYVLRIATTNGTYTSYSNYLRFEVDSVKPPVPPVPYVQQPVVVPNVFTPNGDGFNDTYVITHLEDYPEATLSVVNRWGQEVLPEAKYRNDWDGGDARPGTYYYILKLAEGQAPMKGQLRIIR